MMDTLAYGPGWPGWREVHGYAAGLALAGPLGLTVACPAGETRAELQAPWDAMEGDDHWYGVTLQLPSGFVGAASDWCVVVQAHEDGVAKPPPWAIVAKTTGLRLEMRHRDGRREIRDLGPVPVDVPARVAVHCVSTVTEQGRVEAFRDGVSAGVVVGSTRYTTRYPVRPRVGIYRSHTVGVQTAWFGPLLRGQGMAEVSPRDCTALVDAVSAASARAAAAMEAWQSVRQAYWDAEAELAAAETALANAKQALADCRER